MAVFVGIEVFVDEGAGVSVTVGVGVGVGRSAQADPPTKPAANNNKPKANKINQRCIDTSFNIKGF